MLTKIFKLLSPGEKKFYLIIFFLTLICAFFEVLSISILIPAINIILGDFESSKFYLLANTYVNLTELTKYEILIFFGLFTFFIFLLKNSFLVLNLYLNNKHIYSVRFRLMNKLYSYYLKKNYNFHLKNNSALLIRNINAASAIGMVVLYYSAIATDLIIGISLIFFSFLFLPKVFYIVVILVLLISFLYYKSLKKKLTEWSYKEQDLSFRELQSVQQGLGAIKEILISNKNFDFINKFRNITNELRKVSIRKQIIPQLSRFVFELLAVIVLFSTILILFKDNSPSEIILKLSVLVIIIFRLMPIIVKVLNSFQKLNTIYPPASIALNEFFSKKNENLIENLDKIEKFDEIVFKNVSYKYEDKKVILKNINITIKKMDVIGLIGESGSGKTTLVDILTGLLIPTSGQLLINKNQMYKRFVLNTGYVSQFTYLKDHTILNNIAFFDEDRTIDSEKIRKILKIVKLENFVNKLPDNINTNVGEKGSKLSGGEKQRIGVARALYYEPDILVLDEPTSMLDEKNENELLSDLFENYKKKCTVIMISHKTENLKYCDKIFKIKDNQLEQIR